MKTKKKIKVELRDKRNDVIESHPWITIDFVIGLWIGLLVSMLVFILIDA